MTCHEARTLLYDLQTMRTDPNARPDERGSRFALAKAHVLTCVLCNGFFEQERAFVHALHDRITHIPQPVPVSALSNTLTLVQQARIQELEPTPRRFRQRFRALLRHIIFWK